MRDIPHRDLVVQSRREYRTDICQEPLFILNTLLIGGIAKGNCHNAFATDIEVRNGCVSWEFLAVFAQAEDRGLSLTHSASSRLTRCEPGHVFSVDHSKPLWNQNVQGGTYRFGFRVTKDLFRALVEQGDALVLVNADYCVRRDRDDP